MRESNHHILSGQTFDGDAMGGNFMTDYLRRKELHKSDKVFEGVAGQRELKERNENLSMLDKLIRNVGKRVVSKITGGGLEHYETRGKINMRNMPSHQHRESNKSIKI